MIRIEQKYYQNIGSIGHFFGSHLYIYVQVHTIKAHRQAHIHTHTHTQKMHVSTKYTHTQPRLVHKLRASVHRHIGLHLTHAIAYKLDA